MAEMSRWFGILTRIMDMLMSDFIQALGQFEFMQFALLAVLLSSIACGVIGSYVVVRRISYIAGGISHSVLGGLGAAKYLQQVQGWTWLDPFMGAVIAALLSAMIIGYVSLRAKQREDTVIGAIWAVGMATGLLFIYKTPGYNEDLMRYLFGNPLMVSSPQLQLLILLDVLIVGAGLLFYRQFQAVCFDEQYSRLRGISVEFYYLMLLCLAALTVVLLSMVVGIVLVIALLTLPAAVAGHFCRQLWSMMFVSVVLSALLSTGGLALSYTTDLPSGATIVVLCGAAYLITAATSNWSRRQG